MDKRLLERIAEMSTPFYLYDGALLRHTLQSIAEAVSGHPIRIHYAVKANGNPGILSLIAAAGLGADCVSGGEIEASIKAGFAPASICYACVGKTDREILQALKVGIGCFNVESIEELGIISHIAEAHGFQARVALRVNPDIDAHTHHYITTGLEENKFGIDMRMLDKAVDLAMALPGIELTGLHFHIGSQVTVMAPFEILCRRINDLLDRYQEKGVEFKTINVGGGLGIDYDHPDFNPIPDFKAYFDTFIRGIRLSPGQEIHCELGRAVVAQCGSLISRVILVKEGVERKFVVIDAGMNDLIRPALYHAHHNIENLTTPQGAPIETYDVVGPICESSDTFAVGERLPHTQRGDLIAIRSAGAYGESMASTYNMRPLVSSLITDE